MAAITPHCPYLEFLPANLCDSLLRKELVTDELKIVNGQIPLPRKPGLGIEVNRQALRKFGSRDENTSSHGARFKVRWTLLFLYQARTSMVNPPGALK